MAWFIRVASYFKPHKSRVFVSRSDFRLERRRRLSPLAANPACREGDSNAEKIHGLPITILESERAIEVIRAEYHICREIV